MRSVRHLRRGSVAFVASVVVLLGTSVGPAAAASTIKKVTGSEMMVGVGYTLPPASNPCAVYTAYTGSLDSPSPSGASNESLGTFTGPMHIDISSPSAADVLAGDEPAWVEGPEGTHAPSSTQAAACPGQPGTSPPFPDPPAAPTAVSGFHAHITGTSGASSVDCSFRVTYLRAGVRTGEEGLDITFTSYGSLPATGCGGETSVTITTTIRLANDILHPGGTDCNLPAFPSQCNLDPARF